MKKLSFIVESIGIIDRQTFLELTKRLNKLTKTLSDCRMDALTHLFTAFNFRTDLFFIGQLCRTADFNEPNKGYLHFIRQGQCWFNQQNSSPIKIDRPCVVFSPTNALHNIHPIENEGLDVFCINFDFGEGVRNPLTESIHHSVVLYLDEQPILNEIAQLIFNENHRQSLGYQAIIHHLCAYFTIEVARCCIEQNLLQTGLLQGLTDKQLAKVIWALHKHPEQNWTVEKMATLALMSRAKFASYFKEIMGVSPMDYLTNWRISVAQSLLQKGLSVSLVAEKVGYSHNAALTRIFIREIGITPTEWLNRYQIK